MYESRKRSIVQEFSSRGHQYCLYRGSMEKCDSNSNRVKETWMSSSSRLECSLSWPPRSYSCSFCKKELRSAQALGGHMNVHRKDKARLRESPPHPGLPVWNFTNPNLNSTIGSCSNIPNLNMPPPSTSVADCDVIRVTYTSPATEPSPFVPLCSSSTASKGLARTARRVELAGEGISRGDLRKNKRVVNLDLEMGLFGTNHGDGPDLELRLGCS